MKSFYIRPCSLLRSQHDGLIIREVTTPPDCHWAWLIKQKEAKHHQCLASFFAGRCCHDFYIETTTYRDSTAITIHLTSSKSGRKQPLLLSQGKMSSNALPVAQAGEHFKDKPTSFFPKLMALRLNSFLFPFKPLPRLTSVLECAKAQKCVSPVFLIIRYLSSYSNNLCCQKYETLIVCLVK